MKVSLEEVMAHQTPAGGWKKKQLALWGVPWPPPKGWKTKLTGGAKEVRVRGVSAEALIKYPFYAKINGKYVYVTRTQIVH